ncbi:E3 ubiquitin-protein ligase TRIM21-like [Triplophysa rosa]|uniref:E3 ubiquitin-protein ligase TRIM21-like n=1 Tax=Triplophysa rosa TaxID=992332 RepID=UPI002545EEC1|nr:E3 ubiquitin-protein ligase TRIM21-like [Triplophysa rosa]
MAMASSSGPLDEELQCSVCLDVFNDPVTTPCGHTFCKTCLNECWENTENCVCPFCKETFMKRPDLKINTTLREVVKHLLVQNLEKSREVVQHFKEKIHLDKPAVFCDFCTEKKKALKTCLMCQSSYCQTHLEPHTRVQRLKKHTLINPVINLDDYICQKHERPLELFCRDDHTCVCVFCTEGDHKTHNTVSIEEESRQRKTQLVKTQTDTQQMIQDRIKKIQDIEHSVELMKRKTDQEKADSVEMFRDLIRSIERCQCDVLKMMEEKQKRAEKHAEDVMKDLEQDISELKKRNVELEQIMSNTEDHLHLIQISSSLCTPVNMKNCSDISVDTSDRLNTVTPLTQLKQTLDHKLDQTVLMKKLFAVDVTLDADTASPYLILSDDRKQVRHGDVKQDVSDNPERFDKCSCVLGKEGFSSGRFYFEVQVSGKTEWDLGVARESINRKGRIRLKPVNGYWTVALWNENEYKALDDSLVSLSLSVSPQKVGVFVDYEEGLVSFYDVESRSHIYSYTGQTFTETLYPYFCPSLNDEGKNSKPLIILPVRE